MSTPSIQEQEEILNSIVAAANALRLVTANLRKMAPGKYLGIKHKLSEACGGAYKAAEELENEWRVENLAAKNEAP